MPYIDLTKLDERAKAVKAGYIWSAPQGAIEHALMDIKAGHYPPPAYIPNEYKALAESYGVTASSGGLDEGTGPA